MSILELQEKIEQYISQNQFEGTPIELYRPANYIIALGGKRIRPLLLLLAYQLNKKDIEKALPAALCIEWFHNFSLIHDDIMDNAEKRRGQPTVHIRWNMPTAILSGDMLLVKTYQLLSTHYHGTILEALLKEYNTMAIEVCEGQQMDMLFERNHDISKSDYLQMIRLKTSVLLGCSLKMGGILAELSLEDCDKLYQIGIEIGLGFQIADDYLDLFGNEQKVGKIKGGDIIACKKSIFYCLLLEQIEETQQTQFMDLYFSDHVNKVELVTEMILKYDIHHQTMHLAQSHFDKAQALISELDQHHELLNLLNAIRNRSY